MTRPAGYQSAEQLDDAAELMLVDTPARAPPDCARVLRDKRAADRAAAEALYSPISREEFVSRIVAARAAGERHIELVVIRQGMAKVPARVQMTFAGDPNPGPRSCVDAGVKRVAPDCYRARFIVGDALLWLKRSAARREVKP